MPELVRLLPVPDSSAAAEAGERLLRGGARRLWRDALRAAPSAALELSLVDLRVADVAEPGASVSWGPAAHLAAAPRPHVRLLGLTARNWPRSITQDPLVPEETWLEPAVDLMRRDLLHHAVIAGAATGGLAVSRPRRSAEGAPLPPSRLWPSGGRAVPRGRVPVHAYGEADRLLARLPDATSEPRIASGLACWRAWGDLRARRLTDGVVGGGDPVVARAFKARVLGRSDSLRRLLRDPLAFLLLDVLGLRNMEVEVAPLAIGARARGELVHEVLRQATDALGGSCASHEVS